MARNYKREAKWEDQPAQVKRRESRNRARAKMVKAGRAKKGDGKDIDHRNDNPLEDKMWNLHTVDPSWNRSFPRDKKAHHRKGTL